jgi:hypothetical protein
MQGFGPDGYNRKGKHFCEWRGQYDGQYDNDFAYDATPSNYGGVPGVSFWEMGQHCNDGMGDPVSGEEALIDNEYDAIIKCQGDENMMWMGMEPNFPTTLRPERDENGMVHSPCQWVTGVGCRKRPEVHVPSVPCWMPQEIGDDEQLTPEEWELQMCIEQPWNQDAANQMSCFEDAGLLHYNPSSGTMNKPTTVCHADKCKVKDTGDDKVRCEGNRVESVSSSAPSFEWSLPESTVVHYSPCRWIAGGESVPGWPNRLAQASGECLPDYTAYFIELPEAFASWSP